MEIEVVAVHEAGHAVMQWLVGWSVGNLRMKLIDSTVVEPSTDQIKVDLTELSDLRKRLVVLLAGREATQAKWPGSDHDLQDWRDLCHVIASHLGGKNTCQWCPGDQRAFRDAPSNALLQDAVRMCSIVVSDASVRQAIEAVAQLFLAQTADSEGRVILEGSDAAAICHQTIGDDYAAQLAFELWLGCK